MTEQEAISVLKMIETHGSLSTNAKDEAIKALEEVHQYRAIGTVEKVREYKEIADNMDAVSLAALCISLNKLKEYQKIGTPEECRAAVEKQRAKKPIEPDEEYGTFKCPNCGGLIFTEDRFETHKYCLLCGQKLDWSDEE